MIQFIRIIAENTFSYRYLDFDFRAGLSAIEGTNGSSKSSIFMALTQGLFNRNMKGCRVEEVNNYITKLPYEITIIFSKGSDEYVVCNSRKLGKITILCNSKDISLKRIPENLLLIQEILGTDYSTFVDLTYQAKESSLNLLETSTDKGRKEFLARVLRLDEIDAEQARLKEKQKDLEGKNGRITLLNSQIQTLEASLGSLVLEEGEYALSQLEEELLAKNEKVQELNIEVIRLANEVEKIDIEVAGWLAEQTLREQLTALQAGVDDTYVGDTASTQLQAMQAAEELSKCNSGIEAVQAKLTLLEKYAVLQRKVDVADCALAALPLPEMSYEECKIQKEKISNAWKARQGKIDVALVELEKFEAALAKGQCPTCGGHADVSDQIKTLREGIQLDTEFVTKCTTSYEKYKERITQWEAINRETYLLEKLKAEASGAPDGDIDEVKEELDSLFTLQTTLTHKDTATRLALTSANTQDKLKLQILETKAKIVRGEQCLYKDNYITMTTANRAKAEAELCSLQADTVRIGKELVRLKDHNAKVRATHELNRQITLNNQKITLQVDQFRKDLEECENKLELLKAWQGILGSKGYRVARIKKFISSLNGLMVKYAQMISGGRIKCNFFITETGEIDFTITDEAKSMAYELWSGGEKGRVKLVCLFAVLELLESMGSLSFNVLALDEIFSALDTEGKEGLFNVLTYLKGHSKAIYTIAHEELVLDLQYDYKVKAEKLSDGTTEVKYV